MKFRDALIGLAEITLLPAIAWYAARAFDPDAQLVGGYLLVSPMLAMLIGAFVFSRRYRQDQSRVVSEPLTEHAKKLAEGLRIKPFSVMVYDEPEGRQEASTHQGQIYVNLPIWNSLSPAERDFVLAKSVAALADKRDHYLHRLAFWSVLLVGCSIATLNLWLILPMHACVPLYIFTVGLRKIEKRVLNQELAAVKLTRDYKAAEKYLRREKNNLMNRIPLEDRLRLLREALGETQ
jgi:hypothetical protein